MLLSIASKFLLLDDIIYKKEYRVSNSEDGTDFPLAESPYDLVVDSFRCHIFLKIS